MDGLEPEPIPVTRRKLLIRADQQQYLEVLAEAWNQDPDSILQMVIRLGLNELARFTVEVGRVLPDPLRLLEDAELARTEADVIDA